ncbi:MAG TPA: hypothetical protein VK988_13060, partial [Acidimicrobiales bacterium]|nr:hypothetical protein [Acidimicrobiales bacterium]
VMVLESLARLAETMSDTQKQETYSTAAMALYIEMGDRRRAAEMVMSLGRSSEIKQAWSQAGLQYRAAINLFRRLRLTNQLADAYKSLARVARARGQIVHAERLEREAAAIFGTASASLDLDREVQDWAETSSPSSLLGAHSPQVPLEQIIAEVAAAQERDEQSAVSSNSSECTTSLLRRQIFPATRPGSR